MLLETPTNSGQLATAQYHCSAGGLGLKFRPSPTWPHSALPPGHGHGTVPLREVTPAYTLLQGAAMTGSPMHNSCPR